MSFISTVKPVYKNCSKEKANTVYTSKWSL